MRRAAIHCGPRVEDGDGFGSMNEGLGLLIHLLNGLDQALPFFSRVLHVGEFLQDGWIHLFLLPEGRSFAFLE